MDPADIGVNRQTILLEPPQQPSAVQESAFRHLPGVNQVSQASDPLVQSFYGPKIPVRFQLSNS